METHLPKKIMRKGGSPYISSPGSNITDAFFYHELCKTSGSDIANMWLLAQGPVRSKGSTATCSPNRSPHNSAPPSPRSRSGIPFFAGPQRSEVLKEEVAASKKSAIQTKLAAGKFKEEPSSNFTAETLSDTKSIEFSSYPPGQTIENNMGLLYTDAAHTLLD